MSLSLDPTIDINNNKNNSSFNKIRNSSSTATIPSSNSFDSHSTASSRKNQLVNDFIQIITSSNSTDMVSTSVNNSYTQSSSVIFQGSVEGKGSNDLYSITNNSSFEGLSEIEQSILRSSMPIPINESEEIIINGERGIWANKSETINWKGGKIPLSEYQINQDSNPEKIFKQIDKHLEYVQVLAFRYLKPPTPLAPGEIIIKEEPHLMAPPAPPLILRQLPPRPVSPEPLVIREQPPLPPPRVGRKLIRISGKKIPPPPRKVVIERLAQLPPKPQSAIVERWLPYNNNIKRKVIFQRAPPDPIVIKPRNVIIQWEAPQVVIKKEYKYLGTIRADPADYIQRYGDTLKPSHELPDFVKKVKAPDGLVLAADYEYKNTYELEGDLFALKLIDLDKEGLSEYKSQLDKMSQSKTKIKFEKARLKTFNPLSSPSRTTLEDTHSINLTESHTNLTEAPSTNTSIDLAQSKSVDLSIVMTTSSNQTSDDFDHENYSKNSSSNKTSNLNSEQNSESVELKTDPKSSVYTFSTPRISSGLSFKNQLHTGNLLNLSESIKRQRDIILNKSSKNNKFNESSSLESSNSSSELENKNNITNDAIDKLFTELDKSKSGRISVEDAEKNFIRFNERLGKINKSQSERELLNRIRMLNRNKDSTVSLGEFRADFKRLFF